MKLRMEADNQYEKEKKKTQHINKQMLHIKESRSRQEYALNELDATLTFFDYVFL